METYRTEEEQIHAIKQFVNRHGTKLLAAVVLFIAAVLSYQSYQKNTLAEKNAASALYAQMDSQFSQEAKLDEQQQAAFNEQYALMLENYPGTVYASYANLLKAKFAVAEQELEQAQQSLQWVLDNASETAVVDLARLRLARVLDAKGMNEQAQALLDQGSEIFAAEYWVAQADLQMKAGDNAKALALYEKAKEKLQAQGMQVDQLLEMKINSLSTKDSAAVVFPVNNDA